MADLPSDSTDDRRVITEGFFQREVDLSRTATATFLRDLADQIDDHDEVTISSDEWEIPFAFVEPIEVEVEFSGDRDPELEIEIEFTGGSEDRLQVS